jgi:hypothetical protein
LVHIMLGLVHHLGLILVWMPGRIDVTSLEG